MIGISNELGGWMMVGGIILFVVLRNCCGWFIQDDQTVVNVAAIAGAAALIVSDLGFRMRHEQECKTFADRFAKYYSIDTGGFIFIGPVWGWGLMFTAGFVLHLFE